MTAYRGCHADWTLTRHYALYATTDPSVAERYGAVHTLDLSALHLVSTANLAQALIDADLTEYVGRDMAEIDLDADPWLGDSSDCYWLAEQLDVDGIIDSHGNIEIWRARHAEELK